jgi:hypothetical protein
LLKNRGNLQLDGRPQERRHRRRNPALESLYPRFPLTACPDIYPLPNGLTIVSHAVTSYFGSMQPCEATTCQRPLWFTNTSVHRVFPLMSFPLYVPLSLLL